MRLLDNATPRLMLRWSARTFAVTTPLMVLQLGAWVFHVHPLQPQPTLASMLFLLTVATAGCSIVVAALAACHLSIHRAFGAGWRAGVDAVSPPDGGKPADVLRAVE